MELLRFSFDSGPPKRLLVLVLVLVLELVEWVLLSFKVGTAAVDLERGGTLTKAKELGRLILFLDEPVPARGRRPL